MEERLLTVPQAAARLAKSRWHIYDLVNEGLLKRRMTGLPGKKQRMRIAESDLQDYIDSTKAPVPDRGVPAA